MILDQALGVVGLVDHLLPVLTLVPLVDQTIIHQVLELVVQGTVLVVDHSVLFT